MYIKCSEREELVLEKIASAAAKLNMPCYVIGGFVRDKIIERATKDIDIVCVGDGIELATEVAKNFTHSSQVSIFKNFRNHPSTYNFMSMKCPAMSLFKLFCYRLCNIM